MKVSKQGFKFQPFDISIETAEECRALMEILATAKEWTSARLEHGFANKLYPMINDRLDRREEKPGVSEPVEKKFFITMSALEDGVWRDVVSYSKAEIVELCSNRGGMYDIALRRDNGEHSFRARFQVVDK